MQPYFPTPVKLPSSLSVPQDVIDPVSVPTVNPNTQTLANAIAYQERRVNSCLYKGNFVPGDYADETPLTLATQAYGGGLTISGGTDVVVAEAGFYMVSFVVYGSAGPTGPGSFKLVDNASGDQLAFAFFGLIWPDSDLRMATATALVNVEAGANIRLVVNNTGGASEIGVSSAPGGGEIGTLSTLSIHRVK